MLSKRQLAEMESLEESGGGWEVMCSKAGSGLPGTVWRWAAFKARFRLIDVLFGTDPRRSPAQTHHEVGLSLALHQLVHLWGT